MLSARTKGRFVEAMHLVQAEVKARHEHEDRAVLEMTIQDVVAVTAKWAQKVKDEAVEAGDEKKDESTVFSKVMAEALETMENGGIDVRWAYEQDDSFKISTHYR